MVLQALQKVFQGSAYTILALCVSIAAFVLAVWFPNIRLIVSVVSSPDVPFANKLELPLSLLGSIATNFTPLSASYTIAISVLFGMYVAMAAYFLKHRVKEVGQGAMATGFLGGASGVVGVGCSACGSLLLMSALSLMGASGVLALLPFGGGEFGIAGVILLSMAVYVTAKQIQNPLVCRIDIRN